ncbi:MAG: nucleotidyl transferase AbiEii/AbiGii toxin family protein [Candidatus Eisenbacteria bacterium]
MKDACREDGGDDGIEFDPSSVKAERISLDAEYEGVRAEVQGNLGATRVRMHIDVGFGDATTPVPVEVDYPVILDLPAPRLRGYAKESVVAEKFEAMVALGRIKSRMKDFYDIWFLSRTFDFDGPLLARAVGDTFARRGTAVPSEPLPLSDGFAEGAEKAAQWTAFVRRMRLTDLAPREFGDVVRELRGFLGPLSLSLSAGSGFDSTWNAPGPWEAHGEE